ncbi:hypothetical protein [Micromonospora tulbaghiae]|uniref:hypothetical protein n=1 Tax=Micromonospora tulbaghiae TaxID=479978 RepID=UPI0034205A32
MSKDWFDEAVDRVLHGEDELGLLAQSMADNQARLPTDCGRRSALIETVVALGKAGVVPPKTTTYFMVQRRDLSSEQVVAAMLELGRSGIGSRDVWPALTVAGPAGLAALERIAWEDREAPGGAIAALASVDRERAVKAAQHRLFVLGRAVEDADAAVLGYLPDEAVYLLAEGYRRSPGNPWLAKNLGFTANPIAKRVLVNPAWRKHPDSEVRQAVTHGLGTFLSGGHDRDVEAALLWTLEHDADRSVRVTARARLEVRGIISPQTSSSLDNQVGFETAHRDPVIIPPEQGGGAASVVELLRVGGPGRRWALELLLSDSQLRAELARPDAHGPTVDALRVLERRALRGEVGVETVTALLDLGGDRFASSALDAVATDESGRTTPTAHALWRHLPDRVDVYAALCVHAGKHRHPLITAGLVTYDLDPLVGARVLVEKLRGLREPAPGAVRVWCSTLAVLRDRKLTGAQFAEMRASLRQAIQHVLVLSD